MKRGQVTIFIMLGILIVGAIITLFIFRQDIVNAVKGELDATSQLSSCVEEAITPSVQKVLENSGELELKLSIKYRGQSYNYLCYQENDYLPCINNYPLLKRTATEKITEDTEEKVELCFVDLIDEIKSRGYEISEGDLDYSLELVPSSIKVNLKKSLTISRESSSESFEDFSFEIPSKLYELLSLSSDIVNSESQYCEFDYGSYMLLYPQYTITRKTYDYSKIYTINHEKTNETTKFAIRGCVIPPGL